MSDIPSTGDDSVQLALDWLALSLTCELESQDYEIGLKALEKARNSHNSLLDSLSGAHDAVYKAIAALVVYKDRELAIQVLRMWSMRELTRESQRLGLYADDLDTSP